MSRVIRYKVKKEVKKQNTLNKNAQTLKLRNR